MRRLFSDYLAYAGMVLFCAALWLARRPLEVLERRSGRPVREKVIHWIGRMARA